MKRLYIICYIATLLVILCSGCVLDRMTKNPKFKAKVCNNCGGRDTLINNIIDSTFIIHKDTNIVVPNDTAALKLKLECDSLGNIFIRDINNKNGKITYLNYLLKDNQLLIEALKAEQNILIEKVKEYEGKIKSQKEVKSTVVHVPEPYLPWYVKWILYPLSGFGIILLIYLFIKYLIPLIIKVIRKSFTGI